MKIVYISHGSTLEGAERCFVETVKGLSKKGVEVHVIVPMQGEIVTALEGMTASISVNPLPRWIEEFHDSRNPLIRWHQYLKAILGLRRLLIQICPDLVITNTIVMPCGAFAAKLLRIPHIWYIHEFLEEDHGWRFEFGRKLSLWFIDKFSKSIIVNSQAVFKRFSQDISSDKLFVIYQSVEITTRPDLKSDLQKDDKYFHLLLLGRKASSKGQEDALKALSILINKKINVYLWLVGSDFQGYTDYLRKLAEDLGVSHNVKFIAFAANPIVYVDIADVMLMCSRCEAFGRTTVEAMKLGKAIIGADSGATPELIENGWNGFIYEANNPESLAEKIEILYNDKNLRKQLELNASNWSSTNFNLEKYSSELVNLFSHAI
jgi:glycosyltransferase involved in cell wall biosynthesis